MLARLGGGAVAGEGIDRYPQPQETRRVSLTGRGLSRLTGFDIPLSQAAEKLAAIGIASEPEGGDALRTTIPSFRPDIAIEEDLIEEVMRLVGYDRVPDAAAAHQRRPVAQPAGIRRSRPRAARRAGPVRDRELGLRAARAAGAAGGRALAKVSWSRTRSRPTTR